MNDTLLNQNQKPVCTQITPTDAKSTFVQGPELHCMTEQTLTSSELRSMALSDSTAPRALSILEDYPPEILTLIFSLIEQDKIKLEYPNLAPYYLPMKYRKIDIVLPWWSTAQSPSVFDVVVRSHNLREAMLPLYFGAESMLPLYLETEWFRPETLYIRDVAYFRRYHSHLLEKISSVHIHFRITELKDYERLSKMENIIGMTILDDDTIMREKNYPIPNSVLHLELWDANEHMQCPHVRTLEIYGGSCLRSWPPLTKLVLAGHVTIDPRIKFPVSLVYLEVDEWDVPGYVDLEYLINLRTFIISQIIFLVKLPVSLVYLDVGRWDVPQHANLEYLSNLRTSRIGMVTSREVRNVKLPTTIREITCEEEVDFSRFHDLEYVHITGGKGNFSFPNTIRQVWLESCEVQGLGNLSELNRLEYLGILMSQVDLKVLEVKYPELLEQIKLTGIKSNSLEVKFTGLPRTLKEFTFDLAGRRGQHPINFECIWPESVRRIELRQIHIKSLARHDIADRDCIQWPLQLENLSLKEMDVQNISSTNIAKLNLKVLDVDQDADMGSAEPLRLIKKLSKSASPKQLPPKLREFYLDDGVFELTTRFFTGSSLSRLVLTKCKIQVSSPVQLPSNLRQISIVDCDLTSEMWSRFIYPPKLKALDLLNNKLTTFGRFNENLDEALLEGNSIHLEAIPGYSTLVNEISATVKSLRTERVIRYNKIEGIGLAYKVDPDNSMKRCYYIVVTENGIRRIKGS